MTLMVRCYPVISRSCHILPVTRTHVMTRTATATATAIRRSPTRPAPPSSTTTTTTTKKHSHQQSSPPPKQQQPSSTPPPPNAQMANSKYEYTRTFETPHPLLPNTYIILRIDGRSFSTFSQTHNFRKPNDPRALSLMNAAASRTLQALPDIPIAYGVSDEFSFLLPRRCTLFDRREDKLISTLVSTFTGWYVFLWPRHFSPEEEPLRAPPSFDCRAVCYPSRGNVRDYFAWRQVDAHVNNLYNTAFWALVLKGGVGRREAEEELRGTFARDKNELLFSRFGINYNDEEAMYKKGSVVFRDYGVVEEDQEKGGEEEEEETTAVPEVKSKTQKEKEKKRAKKAKIVTEHVDIINDEFWEKRPWLLE
ncbi:Thg1-domain-containing protein [Choiromyces venosus 120613-1]|uniref:tRNA(His) guanylyltransferase n=1 Tax=Choiromyces venosus 120613-1 TaxID=1336337 RepID=A0A3N4JLG1_9PEZI|nr:Thg1-domain-containing protein [Choiromyces venosus 120613-1]